jgi:hypothetical protein
MKKMHQLCGSGFPDLQGFVLRIRKTEDCNSGSVKKNTSAKITFRNDFQIADNFFVCCVKFFGFLCLRGLYEHILMGMITLPPCPKDSKYSNNPKT